MELRGSTAAPTTTASMILAGDSRRRAFAIRNTGAVNCEIGFNGTDDLDDNGGFLLAVGRVQTFIGSTSGIAALSASSTGELQIVEALSDGGTEVASLAFFQELELNTGGISNSAAANSLVMSDGANVVAAPIKVLTTAITPNSTTTTEAAGVFVITTHATGRGIIFVSDGTKLQLLATVGENVQVESATITTTGAVSKSFLAPFAGILTGVDFSAVEALAASNTNYITWTITNLGQDGLGTNAMLAATAANTTQVTGGSAIAALTKRAMTVHGTAANLVIVKGDRIRITATPTGTLANTETLPIYSLTFLRTA